MVNTVVIKKKRSMMMKESKNENEESAEREERPLNKSSGREMRELAPRSMGEKGRKRGKVKTR